MDPDLVELMEDGGSEDQVAAIIRLGLSQSLPPGLRVVSRFGEIATVRLRRGDILRVRSASEVVGMAAGWSYLGPDVEGEAEEASSYDPRTDDRRPSSLSAKGEGVVVGVVDWGFDFAHPDFLLGPTRSRILALWDQRGGILAESPAPYGYGRAHSRADLEKALASSDPYGALGYHPADADSGGGSHGTHVASIAAGSGGQGRPTGMAPAADLVLVHSAPWDGKAGGKLGDSVTLLEAIDFIARTAGDRPWVVNLSMGRHGEQHDGSTLVEQGLDAAVLSGPGRAICMSAGNYYDKQIHCMSQLRPTESRTFVWEINEGDVTENELEVWYPGRDRMLLEIRSPDGAIQTSLRLGERVKLVGKGREIGNAYHGPRDSRNHDNHINVFLYENAAAGPWEIRLVATDVVDGRFHAWIERDAACPRCQSRFRASDAEPRSTTGTICNGLRTLAVGAHDPHDPQRAIGRFSSSGPTRDGRLKPDLCAPGVQILAARSTRRGQTPGSGGLARMSGTSMAAPHVTGVVALMFGAAPRRLQITETRNLLLQSCERGAVGHENPERLGMGYLDVEAAVTAARTLDKSPSSLREARIVEAGAEQEGHNLPIGEEPRSFGEREAETQGLLEHEGEIMESCDSMSAVPEEEDSWSGRILENAQAVLGTEARVSAERVVEQLLERLNPALSGGEVLTAIESVFRGSAPRSGEGVFEVIGSPGRPLDGVPRAGDLLVRRGDDGRYHYAILAGKMGSREALDSLGLRPERSAPGLFAQVVEGGIRPHSLQEGYARRIGDGAGRIDSDQALVRFLPAMMLMTGAALSRPPVVVSPSSPPNPEPPEPEELEAALDSEGDFGGGIRSDLMADSIPSSALKWKGATDEQLEFMHRVYDLHVAHASKVRAFVGDLPESELAPVESGHFARRDAAESVRSLLVDARAQLQLEQHREDLKATRVKAIRVNSGYRPASKQLHLWQGYFPRYYAETQRTRAQATGGEHGEEAARQLAAHVGRWIGAPGFSLHNSGLAIDFGTTEGGARLGADKSDIALWEQSWFFDWMQKHGQRYRFFQNTSIHEPWHWEFQGGALATIPSTTTGIGAGGLLTALPGVLGWASRWATDVPRAIWGQLFGPGRAVIEEVPMLHGHGAQRPQLVLRWNEIPPGSTAVDVVVHLHGFSPRAERMNLVRDMEPICGLDFGDPNEPHVAGRRRPTLGVLPRGRFCGGHTGEGYDFPAVIAAGGLTSLIEFALDQLNHRFGVTKLTVARLILTGHSGGGRPLLDLLRHHDPDEVHVFDGLYQDAAQILSWAGRRIARDRSALPAATSQSLGALRVLYRPERPGFPGTAPHSQALLRSLSTLVGGDPIVARRYRVEQTSTGHHEIPRTYGWRLLTDAGADLPGASS